MVEAKSFIQLAVVKIHIHRISYRNDDDEEPVQLLYVGFWIDGE